MEIQWLSDIEDLLGKASNDDEGRNGVWAGGLGSPVWYEGGAVKLAS
jgi:hypothetical protein